MKYKVGDKCRVLKNVCGEYGRRKRADHIEITGIDEPNENYYYYILDKDGNKLGSCFACLKDKHLTPLNEFQIPFYVDCPTQEIWDKVEKKMFDMGYEWNSETSHVPFKESYGANSYIRVENNNKLVFGSIKWGPMRYKHIPYQQFLGEEVKREFKVGDRVYHIILDEHGTIVKEHESDPEQRFQVKYDKEILPLHWAFTKDLRLITPVEEKEEPLTFNRLRKEIQETLEDELNEEDFWADWARYSTIARVNPFYKLSKSLMSGFKKATAFIKRLGEPLSTYYSLGWVELENDEFTTTEEGKQALADFTLIGGAKTFEEYAKKELARRKKASKVKDEEED